MDRSVPRPFTPSQEPVEDLERRTVGRDRLLDVLAQRFRDAASGRARPHTLLVGPRGSGKSHLLRVALARLDREEAVAGRLAVAEISEDGVGITRYGDLLFEIATKLVSPANRGWDVVDAESAILAGIGDRTLVLVIENLDRVFRAIGLAGQRDLRSWVETTGRVLLVAATPALFAGVQERTQPWFNGLILTPVEGLTPEQGRELLTNLARDKGDEKLAAFLDSGQGRARVEAIARLTGGSPRIWMVLSECITLDTLDALVPAVEALVESLVPYYQQLLWDLPDNHQAIVRQLADGVEAALTAADIAHRTLLTPQTVSKALSLLEAGRWVRAEKATGGDQRRTWYSLREPMLRHHFQWRSGRGAPLTLVVEILRAWFDHGELRRGLAAAGMRSPSERYLAEALAEAPRGLDLAYASRNRVDLATEARVWLNRTDAVYPRDCGRYVEVALLLEEDPALDVAAQLESRPPPGQDDDAVVKALNERRGSSLEDLLTAVVDATQPDTRAGLALVAAGWVGQVSPKEAREIIGRAEPGAVKSRKLRHALELEALSWLGDSVEPLERLTQTANLLSTATAEFGSEDPLVLTTRHQVAYFTGRVGDAAGALRLYQELLPDTVRVLGAADELTQAVRYVFSRTATRAGETDLALDLSLREPILGDALIAALEKAREEPKNDLLALVWRAGRGDPEAEAQLPAELREISASLRARAEVALGT